MANRLSPGCGCCDGVECTCPFSSTTFIGGAPSGKKWVLKITVSDLPSSVRTAARMVSGGGIGGSFNDHWFDLTLTGLDEANGEYFIDVPMTEARCIEYSPGLPLQTLSSGTFNVAGDRWDKAQILGCESASHNAVNETREWRVRAVFSNAFYGRLETDLYPANAIGTRSVVGMEFFDCSESGWSAAEVDIVAGIGFLTPNPFCGVSLTSTEDSRIGKLKPELILVDE